ncbi:hypothetical protein ACFQY8_06370 [Alloscardovia venturai]|uniref:Uncharacterized protein n=1 Tax=Alloscardovia venturai TaxID=1769421 RepID=A0ABW2Y9V7_9BIFI
MKKKILPFTSVVAALLLSVGVQSAQAVTGNISNTRIDGNWNYTWTKSTAGVYAKTKLPGFIRVCQDGGCVEGHTTKTKVTASLILNGSASNHNDSAKVWG